MLKYSVKLREAAELGDNSQQATFFILQSLYSSVILEYSLVPVFQDLLGNVLLFTFSLCAFGRK